MLVPYLFPHELSLGGSDPHHQRSDGINLVVTDITSKTLARSSGNRG
jgi:hypothetical protein